MIVFNRNNRSDQPISVALNAVIDASVIAETTRGYLGASAIGHECLRRIQFDWMCDPEHPARLGDIFDRGHYFEQRSREHFTRAGFTFAPDDRLKFAALDGMLSGHADGILVDGPKIADIAYPCLWEHKAVNAKGWRALDRDGLGKAYPQSRHRSHSTSTSRSSTRTQRSSPRSMPTAVNVSIFSFPTTPV
jgi:hypothetical protein